MNEALTAERISAADLAAVAAHGQTLFHDPPNTIQWLDPSLIAAEVGCDVVSDFRRADLAAGGQGAPLVPFADYILFRDPGKHRVLLNIGGIANLTYLPAGGNIEDLIAFDTGPGNSLLDDWTFARTGEPFDLNGRLAARGKAAKSQLDHLLGHCYFDVRPPKSLDRNAFSLVGLEALSDADGAATLLQFSALSIVRGAEHFPAPPRAWYASGGGRNNRELMRAIAAAQPWPTTI